MKEREYFYFYLVINFSKDQSNYRSLKVIYLTMGKYSSYKSKKLIVMRHAISSTHQFVIVNHIDGWLLEIFYVQNNYTVLWKIETKLFEQVGTIL